MLNKNLSFQECLGLLNEMAKEMVDYDTDTDCVIYIMIDFKKFNCLQQLIPDVKELEQYLYDYGDDLEECGFDISMIWGEICERFNKEVWYNCKKSMFYEIKWYHQVLHFFKEKKKKLKYKAESIKHRVNIKIYSFKANRNQKKRIKKLSKAYDNNH